MALKEIPLRDGEQQLMFKSIELGEVVRELKATEDEKKEINEDLNGRIKLAQKPHVQTRRAELKA